MSQVRKEFIGKKILPPDVEKDISTCIFCGEKFEKGGGWVGENIYFGTCEKCAGNLIHMYIDTLEDIGDLNNKSLEQKTEVIIEEVTKIAKKKEERAKMIEEREALEKVGFLRYAIMTPIDSFELSYTKEELRSKIAKYGSVCVGATTITAKDIDSCEEQVIRIVEESSKEKPHTIRYFVIPNIAYCTFKLCCAAKIDNNGSTYIFADSDEVLKAFDNGGYDFTVYPCIKRA